MTCSQLENSYAVSPGAEIGGCRIDSKGFYLKSWWHSVAPDILATATATRSTVEIIKVFDFTSLFSHNLSNFTGVHEKNALAVKKTERGSTMKAYCVKCRAKKEMKDAKSITMKNGRPATQGVCPTCGTKMFRIGKG